MPGKTTIVRPGFIVGPDDPTGRFTYWPARFTQPGPIVVPGSKADPLQIIDVRDLGEWLVRLVEEKTIGSFTACGNKLRWGDVITACQRAAKSKAKTVWIPSSFVAENEAAGFPIWVPPIGASRGFHTWKNRRAVKAGLRFRPMATTVSDTLTWYQAELADEARAKAEAAAAATPPATSPTTPPKQPSERTPVGDRPRTQLAFSLDGEKAVLDAWNARGK